MNLRQQDTTIRKCTAASITGTYTLATSCDKQSNERVRLPFFIQDSYLFWSCSQYRHVCGRWSNSRFTIGWKLVADIWRTLSRKEKMNLWYSLQTRTYYQEHCERTIGSRHRRRRRRGHIFQGELFCEIGWQTRDSRNQNTIFPRWHAENKQEEVSILIACILGI